MKQNNIPSVYIVGGLLYGDEGKGTTVEYLVKKTSSKLVVRYGGGPQAAHHIVLTSGIWHCFSQCGSGSFFKSVNTLLSKYMVIYPQTLIREVNVLKNKGVSEIISKLHIDYNCFIVTPYHQLLNRVSEVLRNNKKHGSTGLGVGVTTDEAFLSFPEFFPKGEICFEKDKSTGSKRSCLRIKDLLNKENLRVILEKIIKEKLQDVIALIKSYKQGDLILFDKDYLKLQNSSLGIYDEVVNKANLLLKEAINNHTLNSLMNSYDSFVNEYSSCFCEGEKIIAERLENNEDLIFEGSQGSLLDRIHGIFPHLTKSLCSDDNAQALLKEQKSIYKVIKVGVLRAYSSRHGDGPFVTNDISYNQFISEDHNTSSFWQGDFKIGPFDLVAANYGIKIFKPDCLSITCLDKLAMAAEKNIHLRQYPICTNYILKTMESIATLYDLFEIVENQKIYIKNILMRTDEKAYKSLDLLRALMKCEKRLVNIDEFEMDLDNDKYIKNLKEKIDKKVVISKENKQNLIQYINVLQNILNLPIKILSFGPTLEDKIDLE